MTIQETLHGTAPNLVTGNSGSGNLEEWSSALWDEMKARLMDLTDSTISHINWYRRKGKGLPDFKDDFQNYLNRECEKRMSTLSSFFWIHDIKVNPTFLLTFNSEDRQVYVAITYSIHSRSASLAEGSVSHWDDKLAMTHSYTLAGYDKTILEAKKHEQTKSKTLWTQAFSVVSIVTGLTASRITGTEISRPGDLASSVLSRRDSLSTVGGSAPDGIYPDTISR
jgi:hypothetical protein